MLVLGLPFIFAGVVFLTPCRAVDGTLDFEGGRGVRVLVDPRDAIVAKGALVV